jgi:diguanylate cyclase (GGDEF)-like protein
LRRKITTILVAVLAILPLAIVGLAAASMTMTLQQVEVEHVRALLRVAAGDAASLTDEYLAPLEQNVAAGASLAVTGVIDFTDHQTVERYLLETVAATPRIAGMFWGGADGTYVGVDRDDTRVEGGFRTQWIDGTAPENGTTVTWLTAGGSPALREADGAAVTPVPLQPWYVRAMEADGAVVTEPFELADGGSISAVSAVIGGPAEGVIGAEVSLTQLGSYIGDVDVSARARMFIVSDGTLIAHNRPELVEDESGRISNRRVDTVADTATAAAGATATGGDGWAQLELAGEPYHTVIATLSSYGWKLVVVAPQDDFPNQFDSLRRTNILMLGGIGLLAVFLAIPVARLAVRDMESLHDAADLDGLTGLLNRRTFEDKGRAMVSAAARRRRSIGALMVDIDRFKDINDTYGHHAGDEIIAAVAGRVAHAVAKTDLVGRLGGDELAILLEGADVAAARSVAARVHRAVVQTPISTRRGPVYVTISVGAAATGLLERARLEDVLVAADRALYASKRAGRDRVTAVSVSRHSNV